jgi:putative acetyltransferase
MADSSITVRPESPSDHDAVARVHRLAFAQDQEARLVAQRRETSGFMPELSLVAVRARHVVGHVLFSPVRIASPDSCVPALALAPMAVLP